MAEQGITADIDCYLLPAKPLPVVLPLECVAEVIAKPDIEPAETGSANWMVGHTTWQNQRLPVMSFDALNDSNAKIKGRRKAHLVVLNPVPSAARKSYAAWLCFGNIERLTVGHSALMAEIPEQLDRRYVDAVVRINKIEAVVPKLAAISVAFSYF
ncbi:MAG: hypothetical protein HKN50_01830 [Gammaproteobacteria bacterium]|nr:hypothetical protein [Gammaproteobacteria bacterium]